MSEMIIYPVHYIVVAIILFGLGALGAVIRRSGLILLMSIELMLNASNLVFVAYAKQYGHPGGHALAFFVMAIAAAEAAIGLAIFLGVFRTSQTIDVDQMNILHDKA